MMRYFADPGSPFNDKDAEQLGPWLTDLAESGHGTPEAIVLAARQPDSPAHDYFQWNDPTAADLYRRTQARRMARSILCRVRVADGTYRDVRAFYSVKVEVADRDHGQPKMTRVYVTKNQARDSEEFGRQIIEDARQRLVAWRDRYEKYREVFPSFDEEFGPVMDVIEAA